MWRARTHRHDLIEHSNFKSIHTCMDIDRFEELIKELQLEVYQLWGRQAKDDPRYFIERFVKLEHPVKGIVTFELTGEQVSYLDQLHNASWVVEQVHKRQIGMTSLIAAYVLWQLLVKADQTIMILNPNNTHARHFGDIIRGMYDRLPDFFKVAMKRNSRHDIELINGSQLMLRNADPCAGRGTTLSYLVFHDYDCYKANILEELDLAFAPCMLIYKKGKVVLS